MVARSTGTYKFTVGAPVTVAINIEQLLLSVERAIEQQVEDGLSIENVSWCELDTMDFMSLP